MFRDIYVCVAVLQCWLVCALFFFFKQKTAYEMRISDWSSDVCSSDLATGVFTEGHEKTNRRIEQSGGPGGKEGCNRRPGDGNPGSAARIERHLVRLERRSPRTRHGTLRLRERRVHLHHHGPHVPGLLRVLQRLCEQHPLAPVPFPSRSHGLRPPPPRGPSADRKSNRLNSRH